MTYGYTDAYAGEFYQDAPTPNVNTLLHRTLTTPATLFTLSAIITQEVQFPDVSFYQGEIDYRVMRLQTDAILIRVGQNLWIDDEFENNYREAKKSGMRVGGYWFYDDRISPREQAELLVSVLAGKKFELEIYIDWETSYGGQFKTLKDVVAMMELVEHANRLGLINVKDVGMYTGYYWFRGNSNPVVNANQYNYLKNKPLWLAWYTLNPLQILIPAPWMKLTLWQWGTPTWAWGQATKEIDMNWYNGSREEFELQYVQAGEEPPMDDIVKLSPNTNVNRTIRKTTSYPNVPHIAGTFVASLLVGTEIVANAVDYYIYDRAIRYTAGTAVYEAFVGDKWWKVRVVANGVEQEGWLAEIHKGVTYLTVKYPTAPPPAPTTLPTLLIDVKDTEGKYIPVTVELKPKP